jgi:queuosine precursor transporter
MLVVIYISALVAANLLVAHFGPWFSPINAFVLIGLDLALRDHLHDKWRGNHLALRMGGLIVAAGAISYVLNPAAGMIAIASVTAFTAAMIVDAVVYQVLIRKRWIVRANGSNASGAAVDSVVFPTVAFGSFMPEIVLLQFMAKTAGGALWAFGINRIRYANRSE